MEYYINNGLISNNIVLFHSGVRDNDNINVMKCLVTNSLILDKNIQTNYFDKGINYWSENNINDARKKTFTDDVRRYNLIKQFKFESILDFGCGNGGFLYLCNDIQHEKYGVELNNDMVRYLNDTKIKTYKNVSDVPKENFDIITMFHVLEHLCDPIKTLNELKKKMHKDSLLIIEVPHANDILISYYNNNEFKKNTFWSEHLILHTQKSLENLLMNVGFLDISIVFEQRYNFFNHTHWITKGKPGGHNILFDNNYHDLKNEYNKFLIEEKMTDTLIAYCRI
jgi:SAM-dependent methyltransferase